MGIQNAVTDDEKATIVAMHKEGASLSDIAKAAGRAEATVRRALGLSPDHSPKVRDTVYRAVAQAVLNGEPTDYQSIQKKTGYSLPPVSATVHWMVMEGYATVEWTSPGSVGGRRITAIFLTDAGRANIPDPTPHSPVGTRSDHAASLHPGDNTDFRNLPSKAPGGPVTRIPGVTVARVVEPKKFVTRGEMDRAHMHGGAPSPNHVWEALPDGGHGWVDKTPPREQYDRGHPRSGHYPLLEAIREKVKSTAPLKAAAASLPLGDVLRNDIEKRISALGGFSELEEEYLRFARENEVRPRG